MFDVDIIRDEHYDLLTNIYGRDLGGKDFFKWKHYSDPYSKNSNNHSGIFYKGTAGERGVFLPKKFDFQFNGQKFKLNLMGDLGISKCSKSSKLVIDFFKHAHADDVDIELCFSDDRKILVYQKIFNKYFTKQTEIKKFIEVTYQPDENVQYQEICIKKLIDVPFTNNLGRTKDHKYLNYLKLHPLYETFHFVNRDDFYSVIAINNDVAEIMDISHHSIDCLRWAAGVASSFSKECRILLPEEKFDAVVEGAIMINSIKKIHMLLAYYNSELYPLGDIWISRLDRR
jgi:hypothetical protein